MELFKEPIEQLQGYLTDADSRGVLKSSYCGSFPPWPQESSLVMQDDTALELGGAEGSLSIILWTEQDNIIHPGRISLVGPDLTETEKSKLSLTQIILVHGAFKDEYETYQALQDLIFATCLKYISVRFWPDRQKVWYRVSKKALESGFNLKRCGCTLLNQLEGLPAVKGAEIIMSTEQLKSQPLLGQAAAKTREIMEALIKIHEELNFDCDNCDYREVCNEVAALKEIHRRRHREREHS